MTSSKEAQLRTLLIRARNHITDWWDKYGQGTDWIPPRGSPHLIQDINAALNADQQSGAQEASENDAMAMALMERLGPHALTAGKMSLIEAFEHGWQAARQARPCVPEWMPIETAPKDGTIILVTGCNPEKTVYAASYQKSNSPSYADTWAGFIGDDVFGLYEPTHWMPLPKQPSIGVQSNDSDRKE